MMLWPGFLVSTSIACLLRIVAYPRHRFNPDYQEVSSVQGSPSPAKAQPFNDLESAAVARQSLRPQLNQIRAWVRQGRTDAWIAHQLGVPASQLRDFRSRHGLNAEGEEPASDVDLRDEIEAEIEAELGEPESEKEDDASDEGDGEGNGGGGEERTGRRRRRRRGRRGRGRRRPLEATFDQGEEEGYGIWLDPAVKDDPTYAEHWEGHKALKVTIEPERIVLERMED